MSFKYKSEASSGFGIIARVVAKSKNIYTEDIITTFELEYPRIVHSHLLTHRVFSRNSSSSRAVPVSKVNEQVINNPARPVEFGGNQSGMVSTGEHKELINGYTHEEWWDLSAKSAAMFSNAFAEAGYHKQVANRITEPYQFIKVVLTTTEYENWFKLRLANDADPTVKALGEVMLKAYNEAEAEILTDKVWHTPYVDHICNENGVFESYCVWEQYHDEDACVLLTEEEALAISTSCCGQVSYRNIDNSYDKALKVYERLGINTDHAHLSPTEHQAKPINYKLNPLDLESIRDLNCDQMFEEEGITHIDKQSNLWSGNLRGFIQHRQLIAK